MERMVLVLEVGGVRFTLHKKTLAQGPVSRLTQMFEEGLEKICKGEMSPLGVDRPSESFAAILAFYQTGELHMPPSICPGAFQRELEFWSISQEYLATCCQIRLQAFYADQIAVRDFQETAPKSLDRTDGRTDGGHHSFFDGPRRTLWNIVDNRKSSFIGKLYFIVVVTMVILSIVALGISTEPSLQRLMDNCERIEYMQATEMDNIDIAARILGVHSSCERNDTKSSRDRGAPWLYPMSYSNSSSSSPTYLDYETEDYEHVYYEPPEERGTSNASEFRRLFRNTGFFVKIPNMKLRMYCFVVVEIVTTAFFTVDLALRIFTCPSLPRYFWSVINIADILALLGTYAHMIVVSLDFSEKVQLTAVDLLAYLQVLRSLRLIRVARQFKLYKILAYSLLQNIRDLFILGLMVSICMCIFGSLAYLAENKENGSFQTIPMSWYWAIITMTTVGYGDIYPVTHLGKMVACACALSGVVLFAVTVPIFVNNFLNLYQIASGDFTKKMKDTSLPVGYQQRFSSGQQNDVDLKTAKNKSEVV